MIKLSIITPKGLYKETETSIINVGSKDGRRGILTNHISTCFMLDTSLLETEEDGDRCYYAVGDGILYLRNNNCKILVDYVISSKDIDIEKTKSDITKASNNVKNTNGSEKIAAEQLLKKSENLLKVVEYGKQK